jgi:hypothetical protein
MSYSEGLTRFEGLQDTFIEGFSHVNVSKLVDHSH